MLEESKHADTVIIVLHEIYGVNCHIRQVCNQIAHYEMDSIAPNLLRDRGPFNYDQEALAYDFFMKSVGFENAFKQVTEVLRKARTNYKKVYVLGYSVGATLAWRCSATGMCDAIVGFYGSRIRDSLEIMPACPVLLFFPTQEKAFAVDGLIAQLSNYETVQVKKIVGQHGFADPFSPNYNKEAARKACKEILSFAKPNMFD